MKTTIELPDSLFRHAKATAALRKTTLKELITKALEREIATYSPPAAGENIRVDEDGLPYRPSRGAKVSSQQIRELSDAEGL